jgi:hypothetical protein
MQQYKGRLYQYKVSLLNVHCSCLREQPWMYYGNNPKSCTGGVQFGQKSDPSGHGQKSDPSGHGQKSGPSGHGQMYPLVLSV